MNDRDTLIISNHSHFERDSVCRRPDEHGYIRIIGLERSPVMSYCVQHVVVGDTVLAGARLNVHWLKH